MKLDQLSREEKIELLLLIEEQAKRKKSGGLVFKPHKEQERVITSQALERYLFCSNAFGKTTVLVNEIHWAATGWNPVKQETGQIPAKICLMLDSPEKIEDIVEEYRKWNPLPPEQLHKRGKPYISFISFPNGSTITIYSHAVEPLKIEGSQWSHIFFDEPPPRNVYTALFRGGRIKNRPVKVLLAGTPITAAWMRTQIYEPWAKGELKDVECFTGTIEANRDNLADGFIERFTSKLSERERRIRLEGHFFDLDGLALSHLFNSGTHLLPLGTRTEWDKSNPVVIAIDPHPHKAHVACMVGINSNDELVYLKELSAKLVPREFARELKEWYRGYQVIEIVVDSLGSSQMTGGEGFKSFIEVLNEEGIRARATTWDEKQDDAFIVRIQEALSTPITPDNFGNMVPNLRFIEDCHGIIQNIRNVQWSKSRVEGEDFKPKIDIANTDFLACLKYALACNIKFAKRGNKPFYVKKEVYGTQVRPLNMWGKKRNERLAKR